MWDEIELIAVMSGSHLDTVPAGGNFDGASIVATLEMCAAWKRGLSPETNSTAIATIEEECTAFGMVCFGVRVRGGEFKTEAGVYRAFDRRLPGRMSAGTGSFAA